MSRGPATPLFSILVDLHAQAACGPAHVGFQNLSDVHTRRHTQRVQHDVNRRTVRKERHVFLRQRPRDNTLVPVTAGHLVAGCSLRFTATKTLTIFINPEAVHHHAQLFTTVFENDQLEASSY
jgi:hypothetical protein